MRYVWRSGRSVKRAGPPRRRSGIFRHRRRLQRSRRPCNHPVCGISVVLWPTSFCAPSSSERLAGLSGRCAAVESVAENTSDGVVAPMLYGVLFGAPGALAYKAVNTLDSMVGYRQPPYEDLGWASARLDDLANLAPSRLTMLSTAAVAGRPLRTLLIAVRYGPLTASPNAGMAEAAFAGALGIRLGGANTYGGVLREGPILGDGRLPAPDDIGGAVRLMRRCCVLAGILLFLAERVFRG